MQKRLKNIVIIIAVITVAFIILLILTNQKKNDNIEVRGIIEWTIGFQWTPDFDRECIGPPLIIVINSSENEYYWLTGTCPFNPPELNGKEAIVTGILEKREIDVPLAKGMESEDTPTKKGIFEVINVTDIEVIK